MDLEFDVDKSPGLELSGSSFRSKTPLRMTYEAEIRVFRSKYGGIENVRQNLGFSRRKMCQLLLVDPSAWSRWMKNEDRVPPHVYRSLEWYLALEGKLKMEPELADIFLKGRSRSDGQLSELRRAFEAQAATINRLRWTVLGLSFVFFATMAWLVQR